MLLNIRLSKNSIGPVRQRGSVARKLTINLTPPLCKKVKRDRSKMNIHTTSFIRINGFLSQKYEAKRSFFNKELLGVFTTASR